MNLRSLIDRQYRFDRLQFITACGGSSGPSAAELIAQENASKARAQAEADKIRADRDLQKQNENARIVTDQAAMANADAARRAKNRTLLAGGQAEDRKS